MKVPFRIGGVLLASPTALAPMSGITVCGFRRLLRRVSGPALGLVVTPLVSSEGLTRGQLDPPDIRFCRDEAPVAVQIFGRDPARMAEAARWAEAGGADLVDINAGCPAPRVVRGGGGADLMRSPEVFREVVAAVVRAVRVPVTVKMRSGWDASTRNAVELARIAEDAGVAALTVHGRTRVQGYKGRSDRAVVEQVAAAVGIPVIGSGDIATPEDLAAALEREDGIAGVMVGRAVVRNPWIFREGLSPGGGPRSRSPEDCAVFIRLLAEFLLEDGLPERRVLFHLRHQAAGMVRALPGAARFRQHLSGTRLPEDVVDLVAGMG